LDVNEQALVQALRLFGVWESPSGELVDLAILYFMGDHTMEVSFALEATELSAP
jgi:hypothetical protein